MQTVDLETFKTRKCDQTHASPELSALHLSCPHYHTRDDKRRNPYFPGRKELLYCDYYVEDYYCTDMASNLVEYLFHPNVYKTLPCKNRLNRNFEAHPQQKGACPNRYCPYLHEAEDAAVYDKLRNCPLKPVVDRMKTDIPEAKDLLHLLSSTREKVEPIYNPEIAALKEHLKGISGSIKSELEQQRQEVREKITAMNQPQIEVGKEVGREEGERKKEEGKKEEKHWYTNYTYFEHEERLPIIEDRHHEFKNYREIGKNDISQIVMKYIAAFLNSEGGVLYVGIDDSSVVYGLEIKQHDYDRFLLAVDREGKFNMNPPLMPQKYAIRRIPVVHHRKGKELWVIEIKVTPSETDRKSRTLVTYNRECFVRMNASTHKLDATDLMEYIRVYEEEKAEQRNKAEELEELYRAVDRKGAATSVETLTELKRLALRLAEKVDSLLAEKRGSE